MDIREAKKEMILSYIDEFREDVAQGELGQDTQTIYLSMIDKLNFIEKLIEEPIEDQRQMLEDLYGDILNFMAHEYIHKPPKESDNEEFDNINHPEHYTEGKYECIDVMKEVLGFETVEDFCICNAFKYIWRHKKKNELEDLKKANWYLNKIIEWEK